MKFARKITFPEFPPPSPTPMAWKCVCQLHVDCVCIYGFWGLCPQYSIGADDDDDGRIYFIVV